MWCSSAEWILFILEGWVPWDDAIVVSAGKLRKLWDSLSELRSSLCERRLQRTVLRPALLHVKTAQYTQFSRQVRRHTVISLSLTESENALFTARPGWFYAWISSCPHARFLDVWHSTRPSVSDDPPKSVMPAEAILLNLLSKTEIYIRQKFLNFVSLSLKRDMHQLNGMRYIKVTDNAEGVETWSEFMQPF